MSDPGKSSPFDEYADHYGSALNQGLSVSGEEPEYFARRRVEWLKSCLQARDEAPKKVLDFGCGTGLSMPFFFDVLGADQVVGVDMSTRSLELARVHCVHDGTEFLKLDYQNVPAPQDLVFCNGVFHHILPEERGMAVDYIHRSLRSGGMLSLWDNNPWNPGARWVMKRIPFDRGAIMLSARAARAMLISAGFEIVRTDFLFIFPHSLRKLRPIEAFASRLPLGAQYQILARKPAAGQVRVLSQCPGHAPPMNVLESIHNRFVHPKRVKVLSGHLACLIAPNASVLDVGTGDGWLAAEIARIRPDVVLSGVDLLVRPKTHIPVTAFNGRNLPFADKSFDDVMFVDVLHHADDPEALLREAARVARRCILIKDHLCESRFDRFMLTRMDRTSNARYGVPLPCSYRSRAEWLSLFQVAGLSLDSWTGKVGLYPALFKAAFEGSMHFIARLVVGGKDSMDPLSAFWEDAYRRFETSEEEFRKFRNRIERMGARDWPRDARVAELFCGRGSGLRALESLGFSNIEGIDLSPTLLSEYSGQAICRVADCRHLPFPDRSKDIVVIHGGLHHLGAFPDDLEKTLHEIHRVLSQDGRLALVEPWLTPFLAVVHGLCRSRFVRRISEKIDALATMIEYEQGTYGPWLAHSRAVMNMLNRYFRSEKVCISRGKLVFVGRKIEPGV